MILREARWIADHGFAAMYMPGYSYHPDFAPLDDAQWEPYWALCAESGMTPIVHGGYGFEAGMSFGALTGVFERVRAAGGSDEDAVPELRSGLFNDSFFVDLRNRRPLWQLMYGGVFDRHPELSVMMTEVRADWVPDGARPPRRRVRRRTATRCRRSGSRASTGSRTAWPACRSCTGSEVEMRARDRPRDDLVRARLPAHREHLAQHPGVPAAPARRGARATRPASSWARTWPAS